MFEMLARATGCMRIWFAEELARASLQLLSITL